MFTKSILCAALLSGAVAAQTVTIIRQGPSVLRQATGRVIKNVQIVGIVACSTQPIKGGDIWQEAVARGYSPFIVDAGGQLIKTANRDWRVWAIRGFQVGSIVLPSMIASGMISASGKTLYSIISLHGVADAAVEWAKAGTPNPSPVTDILVDPTEEYAPGKGGCIRRTLIADFSKAKLKHYQEGTFALGQPPVITPPLVIPPALTKGASFERARDLYFGD